MSHKVITLVYSRVLGSSHRKAIMAYMAEKAGDDGGDVFCSKGTIAGETEISRSTVFKTIRDLVREGLLVEVGNRACKNGATVIYNIDLSAIRALPPVKPDQSVSRTPTSPSAGPDQSVSRTPTSPSAGPDQSVSRTPTSPSAGPKPSLEPSLNQDDDDCARGEDGFRGKILEALELDPTGPAALGGPTDMAEARRWLDLPHVTEDLVCEQIRAVMSRKASGPPHSLAYFTDEMQRMSADLEEAKIPLAPSRRRKPTRGEAVPMAARSATIDLDGLAALWAPKLIGGVYVPPSAISPALARHMLDKGQVTQADLRRAGVAS